MAITLDVPKIKDFKINPNKTIGGKVWDLIITYDDGSELVHTPDSIYASEVLDFGWFELKDLLIGPNSNVHKTEYIPSIKKLGNDEINHLAGSVPMGISYHHSNEPIIVSERVAYEWPFESIEYVFDLGKHFYDLGSSEPATGMKGVSIAFILDSYKTSEAVHGNYKVKDFRLTWWNGQPQDENSFSLLPEHNSTLNGRFSLSYAKHNIARHLGTKFE